MNTNSKNDVAKVTLIGILIAAVFATGQYIPLVSSAKVIPIAGFPIEETFVFFEKLPFVFIQYSLPLFLIYLLLVTLSLLKISPQNKDSLKFKKITKNISTIFYNFAVLATSFILFSYWIYFILLMGLTKIMSVSKLSPVFAGWLLAIGTIISGLLIFMMLFNPLKDTINLIKNKFK
ncbi:hypothetical protein JXB27_03225 [Candidatus Woesearchaeota archaeon]|nr:hypothetical protein [Candidatus Woesearchaeota archaeon]